ncbi:hypothetical protein MTR67_039920 [Solanum verrucosum]|uniref:Uncharacterized protein n=1 Tax=Solanum verrucosum TaxID=315347 RepID=A0AAF0ZR70_SOLVR|nr:hypothetical protein MTR67_039920 [Solanum verrucosum]
MLRKAPRQFIPFFGYHSLLSYGKNSFASRSALAFTDSKSYSLLSVFSSFPLSYREMVAWGVDLASSATVFTSSPRRLKYFLGC